MMAQLIRSSNKTVVVEELAVAASFSSRLQGLIGRKSMNDKEGVLFPKCNWIHTFFMSIPIDAIYVDKSMTVKKLDQHLKPWRLAAPVFSANSVIEVQAGFISKNNIEVGDQFDVGD